MFTLRRKIIEQLSATSKYICPKCNFQISNKEYFIKNFEKMCPKCGKEELRNFKRKMVTIHEN